MDLIEPAHPFPIVLEPMPNVAIASYANSLIAAGTFGIAASGTNLAALSEALQAELAVPERSAGDDLADVWLSARALAGNDGTPVLARAGVVSITAYLQTLETGPSDRGDVVLQAAYLSRVERIATPVWPDVASATEHALSKLFDAHCTDLTDALRSEDFIDVGLIAEVGRDAYQHCVDVSADAVAAVMPTTLSESQDVELAEDVLSHVMTVPASAVENLRQASRDAFEDAASQIAADPTMACPTDEVRKAADFAHAAGEDAPYVPQSVLDCVSRNLRWDGHLADSYASPSPIGTFLAFTALRGLPGSSGEDAALDSMARSIDWTDTADHPMATVVLALTFDSGHLDHSLVDHAAMATPASALDVVAINAASERIGGCSNAVSRATNEWISSLKASEDSAQSVWSLFAVYAAARCADAAHRALLPRIRADFVSSLAAETSGPTSHDSVFMWWIRRAEQCLDSSATGPIGSAPLVPQTVDGLLDQGPVSTISLLADAMLLSTPTSACHLLGWLEVHTAATG